MKVDVSRLLDCLARYAKQHGDEMNGAIERASRIADAGGVPTVELRQALEAAADLQAKRDTVEAVTAFVRETASSGKEEPDTAGVRA